MRKQRCRRSHMDPLEIVAGAILEGSDTIHHRVYSGKQFMPGFRRRQLTKIRGDPARVGKSPSRLCGVAPCPDQIVPLETQFREACCPDQTIATSDQHTHVPSTVARGDKGQAGLTIGLYPEARWRGRRS
jgi:hypothetical protein